jgi:GDP-L-fucose synthase
VLTDAYLSLPDVGDLHSPSVAAVDGSLPRRLEGEARDVEVSGHPRVDVEPQVVDERELPVAPGQQAAIDGGVVDRAEVDGRVVAGDGTVRAQALVRPLTFAVGTRSDGIGVASREATGRGSEEHDLGHEHGRADDRDDDEAVAAGLAGEPAQMATSATAREDEDHERQHHELGQAREREAVEHEQVRGRHDQREHPNDGYRPPTTHPPRQCGPHEVRAVRFRRGLDLVPPHHPAGEIPRPAVEDARTGRLVRGPGASLWALPSSGLSDTRIIVTGGSGFVGRVVVAELERRGAHSVAAPSSAEFDLTRPDQVEALFEKLTPDLVVHLAARVGGIGANQERPAELYLANLLMGTYVIEEARRRETPKTVVVGTICSYPKFTPVPFQESALWDGYPEETNAPYGIAKKALLIHAQANRQQWGQNVVYVMPTNLYGPGDKFHPAVSHVIPALIKKCVEAKERGEKEISVWGTGNATREFLYVDDAARAIVDASEKYDGGEPVNLGSGREIAIRELAEIIARTVGFEGALGWDSSKPDGQPRRQLDTSRAEELFGFKAQASFEEGLRRTVDWYLEHRVEAEARAR